MQGMNRKDMFLSLSRPPHPPPRTRMGASELANGHVSGFFQQRLTQLSHHFHQICPCLLALGHTYKQCSKKGHPCHDILLQNRGNKIKQVCSATHTQANKQTKGLSHCGITVTECLTETPVALTPVRGNECLWCVCWNGEEIVSSSLKLSTCKWQMNLSEGDHRQHTNSLL